MSPTFTERATEAQEDDNLRDALLAAATVASSVVLAVVIYGAAIAVALADRP